VADFKIYFPFIVEKQQDYTAQAELASLLYCCARSAQLKSRFFAKTSFNSIHCDVLEWKIACQNSRSLFN
jgi:hypothetical protein